jgi:rhodanese-related sulfurtransferase
MTISRTSSQLLLLIVLALLPAIGQGLYFRGRISWQSAIPESELITVDQAQALGESVIWIDARPDEDFSRDHVPGAFSLNEDRWNELLPQFLQAWSAEKKIVVYCSAKSCNAAREVAERLRKEVQLPNDIRVLQGGWEEWAKENRDEKNVEH